MRLDQLSADEQLALGGLLRLMLRSDGQFSAAEEATLERIGTRIAGDPAKLWKVISQSAQQLPEDAEIWNAAKQVQRSEARATIRTLLEEVAAGDSVSEQERALLERLHKLWG